MEQAIYPSDLTDEEWQRLEPLVTRPIRRGAAPKIFAAPDSARHLLCDPHWVSMAGVAARSAQVENGPSLFSGVAPTWGLGCAQRCTAYDATSGAGSQGTAQCGDHR